MQKLYNLGNTGKAGTPHSSSGNSNNSLNRYWLFPVFLVTMLMNVSAWAANCTTANAGADQTVCATTATLAGNAVGAGETGTWTLISGTATITSASSPTSGITGLGVGANTLVWTISGDTCTATTDTVVITRDASPTTANAGSDQTVCATSAILAGNNPAVGTGNWTLISGSGTITTPGSFNSGVTSLGVGANTFRWTTSNGSCANSTDDVVITRDEVPTTAAAGPDQTVCATTATLAGNTPSVGTGVWTVVSGTATITTPSSPTSGVTGLVLGSVTLRWTISNGVCTSSTDDVVITSNAPPALTMYKLNPGDACTAATELTVGAPCAKGTNAGLTNDMVFPCTGTTVQNFRKGGWYKFTGTGNRMSISTDNGNNLFGSDTRMQLYSGCGGTLMACNDDQDNPDNNTNPTASIITFNSVAGTVYKVLIDHWSNTAPGTEITWCINVFDNVRPAHDCIVNAVCLKKLADSLSTSCISFAGSAIFFNPPDTSALGTDSDGPTLDGFNAAITADIAAAPICNSLNEPGTHIGVWLKYTVEADDKKAYLSIYPNNASGNLYVASLFLKGGIGFPGSCPATTGIGGLTYQGCSSGDGLPNSSGDPKFDKSIRSFSNHPRLDLTSFSTGDELYILVNQYNRLGDTDIVVSDGIMNVFFEAAPVIIDGQEFAADSFTTDTFCHANNIGCLDSVANRDVNYSRACLTNAGMEGNLWAENAGTSPTPDNSKPTELISTLNSGYFNDCTSDDTTFSALFEQYPNNLAVYGFEIEDSLYNVPVLRGLCESLDVLIEDIRDELLPSGDLTVDLAINTALNQVQIARALVCETVVPTACGALQLAIDNLALVICPVYNANDPGCQAIDALQNLKDLICAEISLPGYCESKVTIKLRNIKASGINGNRMFAFVLPMVDNDNCAAQNTEAVMTGVTESCDTCLTMEHIASLPNGKYFLYINGESGQLLKYDLSLKIEHHNRSTGELCGDICGAPPRIAKKTQAEKPVSNLAFNSVRPIPVRDNLTLSYTTPKEGLMDVQLINALGKIVYKGQLNAVSGNNTSELDASKLTPGIYVISLSNGKERIVKKFVKSE